MPEGVHTDEAWSSPISTTRRIVDAAFIIESWLFAELAAVALTGVLLVGLTVFVPVDAVPEWLDLAQGGVSVAVFFAFLVVLRHQLPHVEGARFVQSLMVALLHGITSLIALAAAFVVAEIGVRQVVPGALAGALLPAMVAAIVAAVLAAAIVPERGRVPAGTQRAVIDEEHGL